MPPTDLTPAADHLAELVRTVHDEQLTAPTPCPAMSVADLLDHICGLSLAFTAAARKRVAGLSSPPTAPDGSHLEPGWRDRIARDLSTLAEAWRDPEAWTGMTRAGGIDMPGEIGGVVALDEIVLHGWDLAVATGQPFAPDDASLEAVHGFVTQFSGEGHDDERQGLFGPELDVSPDAPLLDRVLGMAGRDVTWSTD
jgi:uncharacterized protein (TIGR03086 family)